MSIRVAIAGVGNCASSLVQGVEYYKDTKDEDKIPGLMHNNFGGYRVRDIEFVTAFDVDALKVGKDLSEAIGASQNNTIKFADVPNLGVESLRTTFFLWQQLLITEWKSENTLCISVNPDSGILSATMQTEIMFC